MVCPKFLVASCLLAGSWLVACTDAATPPVRLVAVYDLTGSQSGLDVPSSEGARLAVREANAAGGLLGRRVELTVVDGASDPRAVALKVRDALAAGPVAAVFGLSDTDMVLAAAPVAAARGTVFVTSGATSPLLPAEVPDYLFLACFGDNVQAAAGAEWAFGQLGARTAVVLFDESMTYTKLLQGYFATSFRAAGGEVLMVAEFHSGDLSALPAADVVYLAAGPGDATDVAARLRAAGVDVPILGGDGLDVPDAWARRPEISGVYFTTHADLRADSDAPGVQAFRSAYAAAYDSAEPTAFAALGYDTARLLLRAVADAGTDEPQAVRRALSAVSGFDGVTGRLSYPAGERIPRKSVTMIGIVGGRVASAREVLPQYVPAPESTD